MDHESRRSPRCGLRRIILLEAGTIGHVGGILGTTGGLGLGDGLVQVVFSVPRRRPLGRVVVAVVIVMPTGTLAGMIPARRSMRLEPVKGLGYE